MIERVARRLHQRNRYVVNQIGRKSLEHLVSVANVLHAENPWQSKRLDRNIPTVGGTFHVDRVDPELVTKIPGPLKWGKVYERLIHDTKKPGESEVDGIIRVYNHEICDVIDNYNCSAYYEPSYVIARAYYEGRFLTEKTFQGGIDHGHKSRHKSFLCTPYSACRWPWA